MKEPSATHWLPVLQRSSDRGLPISDATVLTLLAAALDGSDSTATCRITSQVACDPSLAVWWREQGLDWPDDAVGLGTSPTIDRLDLLRRLVESLVTVPTRPNVSKKLARSLIRSIAIARCAQHRAAKRKLDRPRLAYWGGLLQQTWECSGVSGEGIRPRLLKTTPCSWWEEALDAGHRRALERCVRRAARVVRRDPGAAIRRWVAAEERSAWKAACPAVRSLLLPLLQQLLEPKRSAQEFSRQLETEKLRAMKELAYGASHEINNPLANISSRAELLLRDEPDPERRRSLSTISSQAFRAHEMLADLMLFAKPPALVPESIDLVDLLGQVVQRLRQEAGPDLTCLWHSEQPVCRMEADPVQLAVAIRAIGQNAIEAMEGVGRLEFRLGPLLTDRDETFPVPWVELTIEDTGPGLSAEQQRHLFDPFYSGREAGRGLGLGLSKAWRIVQLHHGRIEVPKCEGRGATFRLCLPVDATEKRDSGAVASAPRAV